MLKALICLGSAIKLRYDYNHGVQYYWKTAFCTDVSSLMTILGLDIALYECVVHARMVRAR
jgi:hypothetical protein